MTAAPALPGRAGAAALIRESSPSPGRGPAPRGPGWRTGLTGHRALPRATTTMSHRGGPDHDAVTSSWLVRAAGAVWRGNREGCGTPGAWVRSRAGRH